MRYLPNEPKYPNRLDLIAEIAEKLNASNPVTKLAPTCSVSGGEATNKRKSA